MAGHIQDRWFKTETGPGGKPVRVKTDRHGTGMRYRARYVGPDGTEKSKSFPDRQKRQAEQWLAQVEADMLRGQFIDPRAGRTTVKQHSERWLASLSMDAGTFVDTERRIRLHVLPHLGQHALSALRPTHVREWLRALQGQGLAPAYQRVIFANLCTMLTAAVDDRLIPQNPCRSASVRAPRPDARRIVPWTRDRVLAVRAALPEQYRPMVGLAGGCGMRQGEVLGLAVEAVDLNDGLVHVVRQVKLIRNRPVFAPPKGGKPRTVPLPGHVAVALEKHITRHPPVTVTLPWREPAGKPVTASLLFAGHSGREVNRNTFNRWTWQPALRADGSRERYARASPLLRVRAPGRGGERQGAERVPRAPRPGVHAPHVHTSDAQQREAHAGSR